MWYYQDNTCVNFHVASVPLVNWVSFLVVTKLPEVLHTIGHHLLRWRWSVIVGSKDTDRRYTNIITYLISASVFYFRTAYIIYTTVFVILVGWEGRWKRSSKKYTRTNKYMRKMKSRISNTTRMSTIKMESTARSSFKKRYWKRWQFRQLLRLLFINDWHDCYIYKPIQ